LCAICQTRMSLRQLVPWGTSMCCTDGAGCTARAQASGLYPMDQDEEAMAEAFARRGAVPRRDEADVARLRAESEADRLRGALQL
jgi:hypothetical protein